MPIEPAGAAASPLWAGQAVQLRASATVLRVEVMPECVLRRRMYYYKFAVTEKYKNNKQIKQYVF